jgi:hypothetical protein
LNVRSLYNARGALSLISVRGGSFIRCEFSQTQRAPGTYGGVAGGCGVDIESEVSTDVPTGDFTFIDCGFVNNGGQGLSARGGESLFKRCLFWGTTYYSIWAGAPSLTFEDCDIYGECINKFASSTPDETTKYIRCHFEDKEHPGANAVFPQVACISTDGSNVQLENCVIIANKTKGVWLANAATKHILRKTTIIHKWDSAPVDPFHKLGVQSLLNDCVLDRVHFAEDMKRAPPGYMILDVGPTCEIVDGVAVDGPYVLWADMNTAHRLDGKAVGNNRPFPRVSLELNHNLDTRGPFEGFGTLGMSGSPPTSGSWNKGDVIFNQAPEPGKKVGWVCIAGGTVGTSTPPSWRAFGQIDT